MCMGSSDASKQIQEQQQQRQGAITQGVSNINKQFEGFNPQFYEGVRQNTLSQLMPQLTNQYNATRKNLGYQMGAQGLDRSSAARDLNTSLGQETDKNRIGIANQAQQNVNDTMRSVQTEKGNLVNQLVASQDPVLAAQQAVSGAAGLSAPSFVAPLGNMFSGWANTFLGNRASQAYGPMGGFSSFGMSPYGYGGQQGSGGSSLGSNFYGK